MPDYGLALIYWLEPTLLNLFYPFFDVAQSLQYIWREVEPLRSNSNRPKGTNRAKGSLTIA